MCGSRDLGIRLESSLQVDDAVLFVNAPLPLFLTTYITVRNWFSDLVMMGMLITWDKKKKMNERMM